MKSVWLNLTAELLLITKTAIGGKTHHTLKFSETDLLDVSLKLNNNNNSEKKGKEEEEPSFIISFSNPSSSTGGTRIEVFVKDKEEALDWQLKILENYENATK